MIYGSGYFRENQNTKPLSIQLGFACINTKLRKDHIFCGRTARLKTIQEKGIGYVKDLVRKNVRDLKKLVKWNQENGIRLMRISSDLLPHYANPEAPKYTLNFVWKELEDIGRLARIYKQRLTFHPGQYDVLSTPDEKVFQNTALDLAWHAEVLNIMGMDQDSVMVVHGGGLYGDKEAATERFISNFRRLDKKIQRRLVIENCERCYNIEDVLYISDLLEIPEKYGVEIDIMIEAKEKEKSVDHLFQKYPQLSPF
jgi:UV DNA damage endonuclease